MFFRHQFFAFIVLLIVIITFIQEPRYVRSYHTAYSWATCRAIISASMSASSTGVFTSGIPSTISIVASSASSSSVCPASSSLSCHLHSHPQQQQCLLSKFPLPELDEGSPPGVAHHLVHHQFGKHHSSKIFLHKIFKVFLISIVGQVSDENC